MRCVEKSPQLQWHNNYHRVPTLRTNNHKESEEWPQYHSVNNRRWMHLKGGSHLRPMASVKERECRVWRSAKDMEYHEYGQS